MLFYGNPIGGNRSSLYPITELPSCSIGETKNSHPISSLKKEEEKKKTEGGGKKSRRGIIRRQGRIRLRGAQLIYPQRQSATPTYVVYQRYSEGLSRNRLV
ncbi:hypothetical protein TNCT_693251 [Trichonephila clavata]|uniref:Uncharacterized protein n=1 Tax=Trichonephila clavata TaxID=2740835 RepID=A0A8X6GW73_TRICU|nr:hypothetical protein TNCT_693251 [Trichonephila clavata]